MTNTNTDTERKETVAEQLYTTETAVETVLNSEWVTNPGPDETTTDVSLPTHPDAINEYHPEEWHVTHQSDLPELDRVWEMRRVPTAASLPDLHALTYTKDGDEVVVHRIGYVTLRPHTMRSEPLTRENKRIKADPLTDEQIETIQNAFVHRSGVVFWNNPENVEFTGTDVYLYEPGDIRDVFRDADADLTEPQVEGLRRRHRSARPKGAGIAGGNDYRIRLTFNPVPAVELLAVQNTGHNTTAEQREIARQLLLETNGVPVDTAETETNTNE